jgi:acetyl-CoA carboxylase alpha subunit
MNQDFEEPDDWKGLAWDKVIEARNDERRKTIEQCAKIAEPWSGFLTGDRMGAMDRAIVDVREEIAAAIRALSSPLTSNNRGSE